MLGDTVCVVGLGCIGLPMAAILAKEGYQVHGVDAKESVLKKVFSGNTLYEPEIQEIVFSSLKKGSLTASQEIISAKVYIIAVPTYLTLENQPDLSCVEFAIESLLSYLQPDALVLIESTCPIGATERMAKLLRESCATVRVAYCPERVLPGNILHELIHNDRVVGGVDETSTSAAKAFYESFIKGRVDTTNVRTAEGVKLAENAYRDVNIAYANELSMIADRVGIDSKRLIALANRHPRVEILNPGVGVGGHCIAIDPWFLVGAAPDLTPLIQTGRHVNENKMVWVIQKVIEALKEGQEVVACLGLTYKPNVGDTRESPSLAICEALEGEGVGVIRVDPHLPDTTPLKEALSLADVVVGLVAHDSFQILSKKDLQGKQVLDFAGVFR